MKLEDIKNQFLNMTYFVDVFPELKYQFIGEKTLCIGKGTNLVEYSIVEKGTDTYLATTPSIKTEDLQITFLKNEYPISLALTSEHTKQHFITLVEE